ncbi:MAG: hypothetical protein ACYCXP_07245 [Leptospirillum sp.]
MEKIRFWTTEPSQEEIEDIPLDKLFKTEQLADSETDSHESSKKQNA